MSYLKKERFPIVMQNEPAIGFCEFGKHEVTVRILHRCEGLDSCAGACKFDCPQDGILDIKWFTRGGF